MAGRYANPVPQYLDDNTSALAGGKLYFYVTGTTTPQATYSDSGLTTPNSNPVILDSAGRIPNIYASYASVFRVVLKTSADVTVWTKDNVQFADVQELVALAAQLQSQIDSIQTVVIYGNPIRNSTAEIVSADDSVTLTTSFLPHVCVDIDGRVSGTVTAGTMTAGSLSGCGSTSRQAKMAGVSGDSSSVVEWRFRIGSRDALRLSNKTVSMSAVIRQESGLTATTTIALYKANAVDNFSAVTLLGSVTSSTTSSTNTNIEYSGLALTDVSNGLELIIKTQPGASFSTKDFYLTDVKVEVATSATTFAPPAFSGLVSDAFNLSGMLFRDSGTANAAVVTTQQAVTLYDGLAIAVYRPAGNSAAMTLNVDGTGALDVVYRDGTTCNAGDTLSDRAYNFRYSATYNKWVLENPDYNGGNLALVSGTSVTASGTSVGFTGIPSWVKRITIMYSGISTNGTSVRVVRLGDSGGYESAGYLSSQTALIDGVSVAVANFTDGISIGTGNGSDVQHGQIVLSKVSGSTWVGTGISAYSSGQRIDIYGGTKATSGTLDRVQITTQGGVDTFDAGTVNILYE